MPRPRTGPASNAESSSAAELTPIIPIKEETRDLVVSEPRYNDRVLEGLWRDRRIERTKPCSLPFGGVSTYTAHYQPPDPSAYDDDGLAWENRALSEGVERAVILESGGPECRENFSTTTDLMHRWLPQICPQLRVFNTSHLEWLPALDLLPCRGNLTQFGLKELMAEKWAEEREQQRRLPTSTQHAHYHAPCDLHRETQARRRARCRLFSSELQTNNRILYNQRFRGEQILVAPNVQQGEYPIPVGRDRLPIVPALPPEPPPPPPLHRDSVGLGEVCAGVSRCRRVPGGTPPCKPSLPFYRPPALPAPPGPGPRYLPPAPAQ